MSIIFWENLDTDHAIYRRNSILFFAQLYTTSIINSVLGIRMGLSAPMRDGPHAGFSGTSCDGQPDTGVFRPVRT